MIWWHVVLAIGLVGFLSPVTASPTATETSPPARTDGRTDRFSLAIPEGVKKNFEDLVTSITQAALATKVTSKRKGAQCVAEECTARFDFSEGGRSQSSERVTVSEEKKSRFFLFLSGLILGKISRPEESPRCISCGRYRTTFNGRAEDIAAGDYGILENIHLPKKPTIYNGPSVDHDVGRPIPNDGPTPGAGIVLINRRRQGPLCSGFLLMKPWIAVTTADCVHGMATSDLYVTVSLAMRVNGEHVMVNVWVQNVHISPDYIVGSEDYNIAILVIHTQEHWNVHEFIFGSAPFTNYDLTTNFSTSVLTYVNEWQPGKGQEYHPRTYKAYATKELSLCGLTYGDPEWYCVTKGRQRRSLGNVNIGSPFYQWAGPVNYILGMYTGASVDNRVRGHAYRSLQVHMKWILEVVRRNPRAPSL